MNTNGEYVYSRRITIPALFVTVVTSAHKTFIIFLLGQINKWCLVILVISSERSKEMEPYHCHQEYAYTLASVILSIRSICIYQIHY